MKYARILDAFFASPWAILPEKYEAMRSFLALKAIGGDVPDEEVRAIVAGRRQRAKLTIEGMDQYDDAQEEPTAGPRQDWQMVGKVAVLQVFGVLAQRVSGLDAMSGGMSAESIGASLDKLVADRSVKAIVLQFDSPGGSVYGIQELGDKIRGYRAEKKIIGIADSVAASAAYWLISQTGEVNVTPGGQVGSIGVIIEHADFSKADEQLGVKRTVIHAGKNKAEFTDASPLSEDARQELQSKVDHYYGAFTSAVAKGRGVTEARVKSSEWGEGRMLTAKDAVAQGMADKVATMEQVLKRLGAEQANAERIAAIQARAREVQLATMAR